LHSFGAAAKISGAGGVKNGSGMILAFHPQPQKLKAFLEKEKYHYIQTEILQIIEE
jgi:mevalonate kinase